MIKVSAARYEAAGTPLASGEHHLASQVAKAEFQGT